MFSNNTTSVNTGDNIDDLKIGIYFFNGITILGTDRYGILLKILELLEAMVVAQAGRIGRQNSKTRIKLIDVNMTINDKTATIKYNISDTAIGLLLISGNIGSGVYFSIVINYGTKWSMKLLSFTASNTDTSSIAINTDLGKITFNGNSKLESFYKVNGLLFG